MIAVPLVNNSLGRLPTASRNRGLKASAVFDEAPAWDSQTNASRASRRYKDGDGPHGLDRHEALDAHAKKTRRDAAHQGLDVRQRNPNLSLIHI